jgi:putative Holliday junction resolvase
VRIDGAVSAPWSRRARADAVGRDDAATELPVALAPRAIFASALRRLRWLSPRARIGYSTAVRALGLDVGMKTIGVALSDELGLAAHPLSVIRRTGTAADVAAVVTLCRAHEIGAIVIGMPYELSGAIGPRARRVQVFVDAMRAALPAVECHLEDERFTTAAAERVLLAGDVSRARRKQVIDKQAAAVILQGWLDARRPRT